MARRSSIFSHSGTRSSSTRRSPLRAASTSSTIHGGAGMPSEQSATASSLDDAAKKPTYLGRELRLLSQELPGPSQARRPCTPREPSTRPARSQCGRRGPARQVRSPRSHLPGYPPPPHRSDRSSIIVPHPRHQRRRLAVASRTADPCGIRRCRRTVVGDRRLRSCDRTAAWTARSESARSRGERRRSAPPPPPQRRPRTFREDILVTPPAPLPARLSGPRTDL